MFKLLLVLSVLVASLLIVEASLPQLPSKV